jgi:uncharacterized protein
METIELWPFSQGKIDEAPDGFIVGLVLFTGQQTLSFGQRLRAMPVSALWEVSPPV